MISPKIQDKNISCEILSVVDENNNANAGAEPPLKRRKVTSKWLSKLKSEPNEITIAELKRKKPQSKWAQLPPEILAMIFGYVVESDHSALPCLTRFSKVCSHWRRVTRIPFLWTHLWFRPSIMKNEKILKKNLQSLESLGTCCFRDVHRISCTELASTAPKIFQLVASNAAILKSVTAIRCSTLSYKNCLQILMKKHGKSIEEFSIRDTNISSIDLKKIIAGLGDTLHTFEVNNPTVPRILNISFNHLKNLSVLKIESGEVFYVCRLKELHLLTVVHLTNMRLDTRECMEIEWPELRDLDLSCRNLPYGLCESDNRMLLRMLYSSLQVQRINLRNRKLQVWHLFSFLMASRASRASIEYLDITRFSGDDSDLSSLLLVAGASLKELYLDCYPRINEAINKFRNSNNAKFYWQTIRKLSMRQTEISSIHLKYLILDCLENIEILDVTGCRYLPRGCRKEWSKVNMLDLLSRLV